MEIIDEGLKKLRRTLRKPDTNKESLEIINQVQAAAVASKALTPAKAAKMPEAERQKFVAGYRKDMAAMIVQLLNMEIAVLDGNNDKANEIHKSMKQIEDEGHKKYEE
jgi:soluble cytochrome b562